MHAYNPWGNFWWWGMAVYSLRSRREWVPARTSVPNASAESRAGREKNGEESSWIQFSRGLAAPASYAG